MKKLLAVVGLVALAACSNPADPKVEFSVTGGTGKPPANACAGVLTEDGYPTRPYILWHGPGQPITWVCGRA